MTIEDKARQVHVLWALFDGESLLENMILKRLVVEIKELFRGVGMPTHADPLMEGEIGGVDLFCTRVTQVLEGMMIAKSK